MKSGTMYKSGDILLIPIPFTDLSSAKKRPCIVISGTNYNRLTKDIIVMAITSKLSDKKYSVRITNDDLAYGMLPTTSQIRVDKIYTISQKIVQRKLASANTEINDKIFELFDEIISN